MKIITERLILRRWTEADTESLEVIRNVFCGSECYAVCKKEDNKAIGAVELKLNGYTDMTERYDECELGFWIGKPFWGRGYIPEAAAELIRRGFEELGMNKILRRKHKIKAHAGKTEVRLSPYLQRNSCSPFKRGADWTHKLPHKRTTARYEIASIAFRPDFRCFLLPCHTFQTVECHD